MNAEEINVAVAEASGYRIIRRFKVTKCPDGSDWVIIRIIRPDGTTEDCLPWDIPKLVPNYHASLDACATFEATLTDKEYKIYALRLGPLTSQRVREYISASAPVRCEAFLYVKGITPPASGLTE